jgi:hypothetical protein
MGERDGRESKRVSERDARGIIIIKSKALP